MLSLCFAHANGFPAASYRKLLERLSEDYLVHAPKMLGHDPRYPINENWENLTRELIDFIEGCKRPVIGVGHSLGGLLVYLAAQWRPELFRCIVIMDPPAYRGLLARTMYLAKRGGLIDRITPAGRTRGRRAHWPSRQAFHDALRGKPLFHDFDPDCLWDYVNHGTEEHEDGVRLLYDPAVETEIFRNIPHNLTEYPPLRVPGALIVAEDSDVTRLSDMRRLASRHSLHLSHMPGGHMFPLERPLETAERLKRLLPELLAASDIDPQSSG